MATFGVIKIEGIMPKTFTLIAIGLALANVFLLVPSSCCAQTDFTKTTSTPKLNYYLGLWLGPGWGSKEIDGEHAINGGKITNELSLKKHHVLLEYSEYTDLPVIQLFNPSYYSYQTVSISYGYQLGWRKLYWVPHVGAGYMLKQFNNNIGGGDLFSGNIPPNYVVEEKRNYACAMLGITMNWQPKRLGMGLILQQNFNPFNHQLFAGVAVRFRVNRTKLTSIITTTPKQHLPKQIMNRRNEMQ
ncbi:MAG: hypothetical protein EAY75_01625 [Bacteroidetes bacterium]|nr:MAG: hypothetical protein EAY75_01625 [Bacteroidota bacterium]